MRVAIYTRVSTDDKGQDPLNQLLTAPGVRPPGRARPLYGNTRTKATAKNGERTGSKVISWPRLGGLHHRYAAAA
jgi:hypothetical protein